MAHREDGHTDSDIDTTVGSWDEPQSNGSNPGHGAQEWFSEGAPPPPPPYARSTSERTQSAERTTELWPPPAPQATAPSVDVPAAWPDEPKPTTAPAAYEPAQEEVPEPQPLPPLRSDPPPYSVPGAAPVPDEEVAPSTDGTGYWLNAPSTALPAEGQAVEEMDAPTERFSSSAQPMTTLPSEPEEVAGSSAFAPILEPVVDWNELDQDTDVAFSKHQIEADWNESDLDTDSAFSQQRIDADWNEPDGDVDGDAAFSQQQTEAEPPETQWEDEQPEAQEAPWEDEQPEPQGVHWEGEQPNNQNSPWGGQHPELPAAPWEGQQPVHQEAPWELQRMDGLNAQNAHPSETSSPTAESLRPETLVRGRRQAPGGGWRRAVYTLTGGLVHPGESGVELRRRELINRVKTPVAGGHYRLAVLSLKGGVGKTTTTAALGSMLASLRGDRVLAVDANPDRGTLSDKVRLESAASIRDLLNERHSIQRYADFRAFTSQAVSRLEILASDRDPAVSEAFSEEDYREVARILEHFYSICITDCGTGLLHSAMSGVLGLADQIVLVSSPSVDGARSASATLDWLEAHQYGDLVRGAVVVLSMVHPKGRGSVDLAQLEEHFRRRCRAVVKIPWDTHLEEGAEIDLDQLDEGTRDAYLDLAANVGEAFAWPH